MHTKPVRNEKIIQFGDGRFLRGFFDWIVQITNEVTDFDASIVVVQNTQNGRCDRLEAQGCVYTNLMRGLCDGVPTVQEKRIDCISRTVNPYADFASYLALAEIPSMRFITSNTTEAGIVFCAEDRMEQAPYISFPAKVTLLLKRRFELGLGGFIFLPCELIDQNGTALKRCILDYVSLWSLGEAFAAWVEQENIFCNTLVDRIVTGFPEGEDIALEYNDPLLNASELFHLWVIDGYAALNEEFPFDKTDLNVLVTDALERYRIRKVRILNGAHTAMIPYAMLRGLQTVGDCMQDQEMSAFVRSCVYDEIIPTLDLPREELLEYADNVFERFRNPFIKHYCAAISLYSVSKFKVRVLPSILEYIRRTGQMPEKLLFSFAKLIDFYRLGTPNDNEKVVKLLRNSNVKSILANQELWGEDLSHLATEVEKYVAHPSC